MNKQPTIAAVVDLTKATPEEKSELVCMAIMMYAGEKCRFCLKQHDTLESLKTVVFAGYHEHGRIACRACWDAAPQAEKDKIEADGSRERRERERVAR